MLPCVLTHKCITWPRWVTGRWHKPVPTVKIVFKFASYSYRVSWLQIVPESICRTCTGIPSVQNVTVNCDGSFSSVQVTHMQDCSCTHCNGLYIEYDVANITKTLNDFSLQLHWKLRIHWLKILRQRYIVVVTLDLAITSFLSCSHLIIAANPCPALIQYVLSLAYICLKKKKFAYISVEDPEAPLPSVLPFTTEQPRNWRTNKNIKHMSAFVIPLW